MKKAKILFLVLLFLGTAAGLLYIFLPPNLPTADNSTPARELISHYYSDEELEKALSEIIESEYSRPYKYENLNDLKHFYRFECLRDPSVYSDEYKPYVVLMSESGKKLFLFYDPQTFEIVQRTIIEEFMPLAEVQTLIKAALAVNRNIRDYAYSNGKCYGDVFELFGDNKRALMHALESYNTGTSVMSAASFHLCGVEEGVLALGLWAGAEINVKSMVFYPNELVFGDKPLHKAGRPFDLWPVLPIDKTE